MATKKRKAGDAAANASKQKENLFPKQLNPIPYGCSNSLANTCFQNRPPPSVVDYVNLQTLEMPADFHLKNYGDRAAKGKERAALLMGYVTIHIVNIRRGEVEALVARHIVENYEEEGFDVDGQFPLPHGQIPVTRLLDIMEPTKEQKKQKKKAGGDSMSIPDANERTLLGHVYANQSPQASQWEKPFLRVVTNHVYNEASQRLTVHLYLYFTRLIFELIADTGMKALVEGMTKAYEVIPVRVRPPQPVLFKSTGTAIFEQNRKYKYSLPGLLKHAESTGYRLAESEPPGLKVQLYDFQKSTHQWMMDQEKFNLNDYFWEACVFPDGMRIYYFPSAGEFRLRPPPKRTGGLLCEEMGLGKTVEVIALILANPRPSPPAAQKVDSNAGGSGEAAQQSAAAAAAAGPGAVIGEAKEKAMVESRATLIVVPPTLLDQWTRELQQRVDAHEVAPL